MNKTQIALAVALITSVTSHAHAAEAAAPAPDWTISGNVSLSSDYRFRGISQTDRRPSLSGGFDLAHSSGFYIGNWNSNIDSGVYGANFEMDFYGGYKGALGGVGYDIGAIYYYYPGSDRDGGVEIKNTEIYVGGTYGPVSAKVYYPISDFFSAEEFFPGAGNAAGSYYVDLSAAHDLGGGFGVNAHVGYQKLKGAAGDVTEIDGTVFSSYTDWKLGVTYTFANGYVAGLAYVDTNRDVASPAAGNRKITSSTGVLTLSKTF